MTLRPAKISRILMYWVALQKKKKFPPKNPPLPPIVENMLTESGEDLLTETSEVLTT